MQQSPTIPYQPASGSGEVEPPIGSGPKNREGWRSVVSTVLILLAAPLIAILLTTFVFQSYEVDGPSMETTLSNHDRLIVWKVPRTLARLTKNPYIPVRGEVVVFTKTDSPLPDHEAEDKQLIKRVIGLPGERVVVKDGKVTVYNKEHPGGFDPDAGTEYAESITVTPGNVDIVVPDSDIFVCGDNRNNSLDSRSFGTIKTEDIVGKLIFRIFPLSKAQGY